MEKPDKPDPEKDTAAASPDASPDAPAAQQEPKSPSKPREIGGPKGPEPTRYGDWEQNGRCTDY